MAEVYQNQKQQANQSPYHGLSTEECIAMEKQAVNAVKLFAKCNQTICAFCGTGVMAEAAGL